MNVNVVGFWVDQVDKAGATALFEEENKGANNVGVVVTPVRLTSLDEFGTPQFVAEKLIQAEKRKVCSCFYAIQFGICLSFTHLRQ